MLVATLLALAAPAWASEEDAMNTLVGKARNAKGGAVLLVEDAPVYLEGLDAWPEGVEGATVRAHGQMATRAYLPEARVGPDGAVSQGTPPGSQDQVMTSPTWTPLGFRAPWSLRFDDGSHNHTDVTWAEGASEGTWAYRPVSPSESSSGSYSGGTPATAAVDEAKGFALWQLASPLVASGKEPPSGGRRMGTGVLTLTEAGTERAVFLDMQAASAFTEQLAAWRTR